MNHFLVLIGNLNDEGHRVPQNKEYFFLKFVVKIQIAILPLQDRIANVDKIEDWDCRN
ncbi:MAG: hypothetical protein SH817_01290 [Leptospira sp.]|nr:hypothetical protein [Leptospira sp.]